MVDLSKYRKPQQSAPNAPTAPAAAPGSKARSMYASMQKNASAFVRNPKLTVGEYHVVATSGEIKQTDISPMSVITECLVISSSGDKALPPGTRFDLFEDAYAPGGADKNGGQRRFNDILHAAYNVEGTIADMDPEKYGEMVEGYASSPSTIIGRQFTVSAAPAKKPEAAAKGHTDKSYHQIAQTAEDVESFRAGLADGSLEESLKAGG